MYTACAELKDKVRLKSKVKLDYIGRGGRSSIKSRPLIKKLRSSQSQPFARNFKYFQMSVTLPLLDYSASLVNKIVHFMGMRVRRDVDEQIQFKNIVVAKHAHFVFRVIK